MFGQLVKDLQVYLIYVHLYNQRYYKWLSITNKHNREWTDNVESEKAQVRKNTTLQIAHICH